ncbi:hypothetical protein BC351_24760 [Paenibacillus ferrarius]|uniref:DUF4879 domain-containing protein n=1 Tax=Paenibacillus ferrarius TaxID=1469647 RepID=A0A1V4HLW1_9BACL|nr:hypothetical protein [Paenibacillus ferrarius]OPH58153.1 hypothetical protein BC351_24760 [Paenibacillus ferrarius]
MNLSIKKSFSMMMLVFVLVLAFAVPAFAASKSYEFYYNGSATSPYNSHVSGFIVGSADVTGTTVTVTLTGNTYGDLKADNGSGTFVTASKSINSSGNSVFTFTNSDPTEDIDTQLYVNAGPHSQTYNLTIHWK